MEFREQAIAVAGARLAYRELGQGPVLLFLHGAGGAEATLPCLAALADRYRLIVPDHPGFGRSDDPPWLADVHDLAYAYLDFLEQLDLREVHLAGTSLGGWVALEIAVRNRTRLRALSLIAAAGALPADAELGALFEWSPEERTRQLVADPALAERMLGMSRTPAQLETMRKNWNTAVKLGRDSRWRDPALEKWLHRLQLPAHVIWGDSDRLFPAPLGRRLAGLLPNARFSLIENCGHLPFVEQPQKLRALLEF